ncbi:MAG: hypothetical protein GY754_38170, partial [bacterium]|nr:hypothetical protein [bacterium]
ESISARGFNPIGQQSRTPDNIFREQALFINRFTRVMGFLIAWGFQPHVMMKTALFKKSFLRDQEGIHFLRDPFEDLHIKAKNRENPFYKVFTPPKAGEQPLSQETT